MKIAGAAVILLACNYLLSGSEIRVIIDRQSRDGRIVKFKFLSTLSLLEVSTKIRLGKTTDRVYARF